MTLALKLPLCSSSFFAFVNACHTFTSPPHSLMYAGGRPFQC